MNKMAARYYSRPSLSTSLMCVCGIPDVTAARRSKGQMGSRLSMQCASFGRPVLRVEEWRSTKYVLNSFVLSSVEWFSTMLGFRCPMCVCACVRVCVCNSSMKWLIEVLSPCVSMSEKVSFLQARACCYYCFCRSEELSVLGANACTPYSVSRYTASTNVDARQG